MTGFLGKAKDITGIGLDHSQLYARAFEKGVLLKKFFDAADTFDKAAKKFGEAGNPLMQTQAEANALLYRYLATRNTNLLVPLVQRLQNLQQIEVIGSQTDVMPTEPLAAELDCRLVEAAISEVQNNIVQSRDLHKTARDKFEKIRRNPLLTYDYVPAEDGHNDKGDMRFFYHYGMYYYYEAMTKKDLDPSAASDDLAQARQYFKASNDQKWEPLVAGLLNDWRLTRTCWLCHREVQGYQVHYSLFHASVAPYIRTLLTQAKQDTESINVNKQQIVVCTPCGSMVTFKAQAEADKVRQELTAQLNHAMSMIHTLENRLSSVERRLNVR